MFLFDILFGYSIFVRILCRLSFCLIHILINHLRIMNKAELINAIAAESGLSKADSKKALDAFVSSVTGALKGGDKVSLVGFGTFSVSERAERTGINPSTKQAITIPAKKVAKFKAGAELSEAVE
jgi:DNA-binding protein HU-beta